MIGQTIARYEIIAELGSGGMGVVYQARQLDLERVVALKVLPPHLAADQASVERFLHEARSIAALEHPHIIPIYDVGSVDGLHYIAMKYVDGHTLQELSEAGGPYQLERALSVLEQVAAALDYAHGRTIIHRDIKPSNIMVDQSGWVYLMDFGLARASTQAATKRSHGMVLGTPEYMAPEQAQGLPIIGPAADIYALGIVLYELLTGVMPFEAETPMGMLVARLQYAPTPARIHRGDLPLAVEEVIMRALARDPQARFQSAGELVAALRKAHEEQPHPALTNSPAAPLQSLSRPATPVNAVGTPTVALPPATHQEPLAPSSVVAPKPAKRKEKIAILALVIAVLLGLGFFIGPRPNLRIAELLSEGRAAFAQQGGLDRAITLYQKVLTQDYNNGEAHIQLARIYLLREDSQNAEHHARAALAVDESSAQAYVLLAEAVANQGQYVAAQAAAERAIALAPELSAGYAARALITADLALREADSARFQTAAADAEQAIVLSQKEKALLFQALAHNARGYVYWQQFRFEGNQELAEHAAEQFNQAISQQQQLAIFVTNLGYVYNAQGNDADEQGDPSAAAAKFEQARLQFEQAARIDPSYGHAQAGLGWYYIYQHDYPAAMTAFRRALAHNQQDSDAAIGLSNAYTQSSSPDHNQAITILEDALRTKPADLSLVIELGWAHIGRAFTKGDGNSAALQDYDAAERRFRQALQLSTRSIDALNGLGWALRGRAAVLKQDTLYDEAITTLRYSLELKEDQHAAHFGLGWVYFAREQYEQAEVELRRAVELSPRDGGTYYWLGLTLERLGRTSEAREAYTTAAELGSQYAQDELKRLGE